MTNANRNNIINRANALVNSGVSPDSIPNQMAEETKNLASEVLANTPQ
jgi:hypothetical protein